MSKADRIRKNRRLSKLLSQNPSPINTMPHQYVQYFSKTINKTPWTYFKLILVCLFFLLVALEHSSNGSDSFYSIVHSHFVGYLSKQQEESGLHCYETMESNYKEVKLKGNPYYSDNFTTNYNHMEMKFKVYMYPEDEVLNKYYQNGSEGYFFKNIQDSQFLTTIPQEAHLFFIPIRNHQMHNMGTSNEEMAIVVQNYVQRLIKENPYWNKRQGADHFFINCHEIGVMATKGLPLMKNAIQVVCTSLDALEVNTVKDIIIPAQDLKPSTDSTPIRKVVRDPELDRNYCSCQLSPFRAACMVESILEECVPAVASFLNLDLPFNDTLDWTRFSIIGIEKDVHLKLTKLHNNLIEIRKHFQWNSPPVRLDAFHMIMYELWQHARRLQFT